MYQQVFFSYMMLLEIDTVWTFMKKVSIPDEE